MQADREWENTALESRSANALAAQPALASVPVPVPALASVNAPGFALAPGLGASRAAGKRHGQAHRAFSARPRGRGARGVGHGACGSVDLEGAAVLPSVYTDSRSAARCWRVLWLFLPAARASSTVNWWALPLSCAARPPWAAISRWRAGSMAAKPRRAGLRSSCKALRTPLVLSAAVRPPVLAEGCAVAPAARLAPWYADREMAWESVLLLAVMYFSPLGWEPLVRSAEAFFSTTHR